MRTLALLLIVTVAVTGCAALLPIALGIQGAISAGSDVVDVIKWREDRAFQAKANELLQAQTEEIKKLREALVQLLPVTTVSDRLRPPGPGP